MITSESKKKRKSERIFEGVTCEEIKKKKRNVHGVHGWEITGCNFVIFIKFGNRTKNKAKRSRIERKRNMLMKF